MEFGINDSLKAHTYGQKKDLSQKLDTVKRLEEQDKQYYPIDMDGNVDEWKAMIKHQQALHEKAEKDRAEHDRRFKKDYNHELDRQRYEKLMLKQQEQQLRNHEYQEMKAKDEALSQLNNLKRSEDTSYRHYLADTYKAGMNEVKERQREEREREKEEERERLRVIERDMKIEEERRRKVRESYQQEAKNVVEFKNYMKRVKAQESEHAREEYHQLCKENQMREQDREQQYKQFFRDFESDMNKRLNNHMSSVLAQEVQKQSRMDEIEDRNERLYKHYQDEKERRERDQRKQMVLDAASSNRHNIIEKEDGKRRERDDFSNRVMERKKDEDDYRRFEQEQRDEEKRRKEIYRETLDIQKKLQDYNKGALGKMTAMEKRINKADLKHFKEKDSQVQAMIPGIHNIPSVGSGPTKRGLKPVNTASLDPEMFSQSLKQSAPQQRPQELSPGKNARESSGRASVQELGTYNPITNPIPWVNQNPYINKERNAVGADGTARSVLSYSAKKNIIV